VVVKIEQVFVIVSAAASHLAPGWMLFGELLYRRRLHFPVLAHEPDKH
jgi:hypothetical protein